MAKNPSTLILILIIMTFVAISIVTFMMSQTSPVSKWARGLRNISFATYSPDGLWVVVAGGGATSQTLYPEVSVFSLNNNRVLVDLAPGGYRTSTLSFTSESEYMISQVPDNRIKIWNTANWELHGVVTFNGLGCDLDPHPNTSLIAVGTCGPATNGVYQVQAESAELFNTITQFDYSISTQVAYDTSGSFLAYSYTNFSNSTIMGLVDLSTNETQYLAFQETITDIKWFPDDNVVFFATNEGEILYWRVGISEEIHTTGINQIGTIREITFSPSGDYLLAGGMQKVTLYETAQWEEIKRYGKDNLISFEISPEGNSMITLNRVHDGYRVNLIDMDTDLR